MRSIWSGSISFGLINIPVRLYPETTERRPDFNMLHKKDLSPIGYMRVCKKDGQEVSMKDIVKGYQYQKGDYVVLTDEELKNVDVKKGSSIEMEDFVDESEVGTELFEKPYFLEPEKGASKVYALLREALKKAGKVGIGRFVLRNQEHLVVLKPEGDVLILNQIRYKTQLREPVGLNIPKKEQISKSELDMAIQLISHLSKPFEAEKYRDTYTEKLDELIQKKIKGKKITTPKGETPKPTGVTDLMGKLKESLEKARKQEHVKYAVA